MYISRYNPNLQQAAQQQAWFLSQPGCPYSHDTCSKFCHLYGGMCDIGSRMLKYEPGLMNFGENVGDGADQAEPSLFPLLRVR